MPQLPTVSAKFVADVEGMLSQLKRAENATRSTSATIDREVDHLTKNLQRKFSLGDTGRDLLRGLGIGSGFQVAQMAAEKISDYWREAAESAKAIEESSAASLKLVLATIAAHRTDEQNLAQMQKDMARLEAERVAALSPKVEHIKVVNPYTGFTSEQVVQAAPDVQLAEEKKREMQELGRQIEELQKKISQSAATAAEKVNAAAIDQTSERVRILSKDYDLMQGIIRKVSDATAEHDKQLAEQVEKYRDLADPTRKFAKQIDEINLLLAAHKLTAGEAAHAIDELRQSIEDSKNARIDKALGDFFGPLDQWDKIVDKAGSNSQEIDRIVGTAADSMAGAWVDAINGVEGAWGNLGDSIAHEIERIVAELLIVKPLINGLGRFLSGTSVGSGSGFLASVASAFLNYGGAKASGGGAEAGYTYRVNEDGQEFFRPDVGGTIIPIGAAGPARAKGGDTYVIDARGADSAALARLEAMIRALNGSIEHRSVAAVIAAKRRRGGLGTALATA